MTEIYLIELTRQRRAVEATLPPLTDATASMYRRVFNEAEACRWHLREQAIDRSVGTVMYEFRYQER